MARSTLTKAPQAVEKALKRYRLFLPRINPTIRITFRANPSWSSLALLQAFDHDAALVFGQPLQITDANFGCLEVDFEPTDTCVHALINIRNKIEEVSEFDDLVVKYEIVKVCLLNFPGSSNDDFSMTFTRETSLT